MPGGSRFWAVADPARTQTKRRLFFMKSRVAENLQAGQIPHPNCRLANSAPSSRAHSSTQEVMMILVAGSTGVLGSEIVRRLTARGESVRAMVRTTSAPEKVERLKRMGAEIVTDDDKEPRTHIYT